MQFNTHGVIETVLEEPGSGRGFSSRSLGTATYPFLALLNHSCDQNIIKYNIGNRMVCVASRVRVFLHKFKSNCSFDNVFAYARTSGLERRSPRTIFPQLLKFLDQREDPGCPSTTGRYRV